MKKLCSILLAPLALAATVFAGILWLNNLVSAGRYYRNLGTPQAGDGTEGFWPAMSWSTLDISTISTFIPFFGGIFITMALFQLGRGKISHRSDYPFFADYDRLNVALGLLGTIWGIIMIGFYPMGEVNIGVLMQCLHTAMFSTLIAVVWVMVILPMTFLPLLHRLRIGIGGAGADDSDSFTALAEDLARSVSVTRNSLEEFGESLQRGHGSLNDFAPELTETLESLRKSRELHDEVALHSGELLRQLTSAQQALAVQLQQYLQENRTLRDQRASLEQELENIRSAGAKQRQNMEEDLQRCRLEITELKATLDQARRTLKG